jgi:hypothetical protein
MLLVLPYCLQTHTMSHIVDIKMDNLCIAPIYFSYVLISDYIYRYEMYND